MKMNLTIRKMEIEDIRNVQQIAKISWNDAYEGIIPIAIQESFLSAAYNDEMMKRRMNHSLFFVSEVDGKMVGFANFSLVKKDGEAELGAIYLDPQYQGQGIGTALLQEGIKNLKGVKEIFINVEKEKK